MDTKKCSGPLHPDGVELPIGDFYRNAARHDGVSGYCAACLTVINQEIRQRNRAELLAVFGSVCSRCGFDDPRALEVDHVDGGGRIERETLRSHSRKFITVCRENPGRYQLLCGNCHRIKQHEAGEWKGNNVQRVPPTELKQGIGRGNAPAQRAALEANRHNPKRLANSQKAWDNSTPEQRAARTAAMTAARKGKKWCIGADGKREYYDPNEV